VNNAGVGWQYGIDNPGTMAGIHEASLENWRDIIGGVDLEGLAPGEWREVDAANFS